MELSNCWRRGCSAAVVVAIVFLAGRACAQEEVPPPVDLLSFAQGALPVALDADAALGIGTDRVLRTIDGIRGGFVMTAKPGDAQTRVAIVYRLPALTTFTGFGVPEIHETPSPSQTFFRNLTLEGSAESADGPWTELASATLGTHAGKGETTHVDALQPLPVEWVRLTLSGGIDVQVEKTFFEFSEIEGYGRQEAVPLADGFDGKWRGRGVLLELQQEGARVTGCYDRDGDMTGSVSGNLFIATGATRSAGIVSQFVLALTEAGGITGVRSTNGAPFTLYEGEADANVVTDCSEQPVAIPVCGAVLHGIRFEFDSATIRPESTPLLDDLAEAMRGESAGRFGVVGHTSSEGSEAYNDSLSQRRAESVVAALIERGISEDRITAEGRGELDPIADNASEAGRALNRRVEIDCI